MNNFLLILHLLIIFFIVEFKCSKDDYSEIEFDNVSFNTTYNENEFNEKSYFESVKYLDIGTKLEIFRNLPRVNINKEATFMKYNEQKNFEPWPKDYNTVNENNTDCSKFTSIIAFEFDTQKNIYLLDEGIGDCKKKLYVFNSDGNYSTEYNIANIEYKNISLTDFVIDTKHNYIYTAYYDNSNGESEMGLLVTNLIKNETKKVEFNNTKFKLDEQYLLENEFMKNFPNVTKNLISITLSCDSDVLFFCPLLTRKIYSVKTKTIIDQEVSGLKEANEGYKNDAASSIVAGNLGNLYLAGVENDLIYIAGQIDNDLSIFQYKGIDFRQIEKGNWTSKLSITNGTLYIVCKSINITENSENEKENNATISNNNTNIEITTKVYKLSIDKERSYIYKCAGLNYKWKLQSYIIWGIFIVIIIFVLVFVFVGNKQDKDINKKND